MTRTPESPDIAKTAMNVFELRNHLIGDYSRFVRSFIHINDYRIREYVERELKEGALWPEPLVQLNPAFEPGETIDELVTLGSIHSECAKIFRIKEKPDDRGRPLRLHRHQAEAIKTAAEGRDYVLTSGTGSGKSLAYIIPAVNHVLQNGPGRGIQAIIVYPMNALANSQIGELEKYINYGYPDQRGPITFKRYTGQESDIEKNEIIANPPDILLTNYVMLELILTRPQEARLVRAARRLKFLVFDELHTYRGRQGADVAMLIRRTREALGDKNLQCVGTSATLAGQGTWDAQIAEVSRAASLLFGAQVAPENVIGESLRRITNEEDINTHDFVNRLKTRLKNPPPAIFADFQRDPLAIWVETTLGIRREDSDGRFIRQTPASIRGSNGLAECLAKTTEADSERCARTIQDTLIAGFHLSQPDTGLPVFAFRLHQFISRGDTVYASPEPEKVRHISFQGQQFVPADRSKVLLPLAFCRECGQEYYSVWRTSDENRGTHKFSPRDFTDKASEDDADAGYIYINTEKPWPEEGTEAFNQRLPDDWTDQTGRVQRKKKDRLPQAIHVLPNGEKNGSGQIAWFIPAPFQFCLNCGVSYGSRQQSDFQKLSALGSEGRSTATTILSLSAIRRLREAPLPQNAMKLLSFTDNRQDASLQAGHFNDFIEVGLLRSALFRAVNAAGDNIGLTHDQLTQKVFDTLALPFDEYAQEATLRGAAREETNRVLRDVLGYRLYRDLKRGWRIMAPNLEQVGLLKIEYPYLADACRDEEIWAYCHPNLAQAKPEDRFKAASVLLDFMRRELAIKVDYLDQSYQESLFHRNRQYLQPPWSLDENERIKDMIHASILFPRSSRHNDYGGDIFLSPQSGYGQYLRRPSSPIDQGHRLTLDETAWVIEEMLDRLRQHGLIEMVRDRQKKDDKPGYQVKAAAMVWKAGDGSSGYHDVIRRPTESEHGTRTNEFFVGYYRSSARETGAIEAREHTAQVPYLQREDREKRFREGDLDILFCSPTMELGIDISQLNAVNMRNIPPTPANYAQRSGRAGRSGQPALVFTYCSTGSPHDQYFFKRPAKMAAGAVSPPQVDLTNEDLIRAHVQAIWLSEAGLSLGTSLKDLLDISGDEPSMELLEHVRDVVYDDRLKQRAESRAANVLDTIQTQLSQLEPGWYTQYWLPEVMSHIPESFKQACDRWRGLYLSALRQARKQGRVMLDASRSAEDKAKAEQLRRNAEAQLSLLTDSQNLSQSDFYSYRYFASEGFLPGYNFPRLPLSAYIPGRRFRTGKDEFLSRPRFLAISEFGPRASIYHEGSRYIIHQAILPVRETEELRTAAAKVCPACGYLHPQTDNQPRDLCEHCEAPLQAPIRQLFRLENVVTKRRAQINCDEEERLRLGYEIKTALRFAERSGQPSYHQAKVKHKDQDIATLYFGNAATLWRINMGWARRRDRDQHGFLLDIERGYWQSHHMEGDDDDDPMTPKTAKVIPYVEDRKNCLLIKFSFDPDIFRMATIEAALKNAIEACYELENSELAAEPLPSSKNRQMILLYESAEGGAGVLRRIVDDPSAIPRIARTALELCHFDPDSGQDIGRSPRAKEVCEAACYDCLMSYTNQTDHGLLDRKTIKDLLLELAASRVEPSPVALPRAAHLRNLINLTASQLERDWRTMIADRNLRLPSHAQMLVEECRTRPDFLYKDRQTAIYVDGPPHDYPDRRQRDQQQTLCMEDAGWTVIRFDRMDDWEEILKQYPNIFGAKS